MKRNAGRGLMFTFHGRFKHKADAVRREQETPGSFIREKNGYYLVMTRRGPAGANPRRMRNKTQHARRRNPPIEKTVREFALKHQINVTRDHNGRYAIQWRAMGDEFPQYFETARGALAGMRRRVAFYANTHRGRAHAQKMGVTLYPKNPRRRRNPAMGRREIYSRVGSITAQKGPGHACDAKCKRAQHWYEHKFKKGVGVYKEPNGDVRLHYHG